MKKNCLGLFVFLACVLLCMSTTGFAKEPANIAKGFTELSGVVNINNASVEELQMLPEIGQKTASGIIDYRTANGPFKTLDSLIQVKGIGSKKLSKIKPYCALEGETTLKVIR